MSRIDEALSMLSACAEKSVRITSPETAVPHLVPWMKKRQEHFIVMLLDGAHQVIGKPIAVTKGLVNRTMVHPREVFRPAIMHNAVAVIVAHNHPSGVNEPSPEDIEITRVLIKAGNVMGIKVLDHFIVSKTGYISMREKTEIDFDSED